MSITNDELKKALEEPQVLHPDLEECKFLLSNEMECIHHPLVCAVPFGGTSIEIFHLNKMLEYKQNKISEYIKSVNYELFISLHERPYRFKALLDIREFWLKPPKQRIFDNLAGKVWVDSENIHQHLEDWCSVIENANRSYFMTNDENIKYKNLPDVLDVYRGGTYDGLSYTTDYDKAVWFASRFKLSGDEIVVRSRVISKSDIFAVIDRRNESEVIINPSQLDVDTSVVFIRKELV